MKIEDIKLSDVANAVVMKMCGYKYYSKHLPKTRAQITAARSELRKAGLIGEYDLETKKAHAYVDYILFLAEALDKHG